MCGIAGILSKQPMDMAENIIKMLSLIQHRGPDAAGIAVFDETRDVVLRVALKEESAKQQLIDIICNYAEISDVKNVMNITGKLCFEFILHMEESKIQPLHLAINSNSFMAVHSIGNKLKVYKEGGVICNLTDNYELKDIYCRHGIGHVRMATESAEDVNAAHPFVSPFYP